MKIRVLSAACAAVMAGVLSISVPAGASDTENSKKETEEEKDNEQQSGKEVSEEKASEGKVLNIYAWSEELKSRMQEYYPGYEAVDDITGTIGDVTVNWTIISEGSKKYQEKLDEALLKQASVQDDERVDLFLVEAEYARKYVETDYAMDIAELGITEENTAGQFPYTKAYVTDADGRQKGAAWYACPGVLIYNREIAVEVLGTDEPEEVQKSLSDWGAFLTVSDAMKEAGYSMTASVYDTYRVFSENASGGWMNEEGIQIDEHLKEWAEMSKTMVDNGTAGISEMWSDEWSKGFYPDGKVFCYFGPSWFYDYYMDSDEEESVANLGGWAVTEGPENFFWGGTWICAAEGTDNPSLVQNILLKMTCNKEVLTGIAGASGDFVNHVNVMKNYTEDEAFCSKILGGQNPVTQFLNCAKSMESGNASGYGTIFDNEFQNAMKDYITGNAAYEEAEKAFLDEMAEKYPDYFS